ncbi:hypothetical protein [Streptomyces sp. NPDC003006]
MIAVAVLLLPGLALLLFMMVRLEDGLLAAEGEVPSTRHARHARRQHLRLIHGGSDASPASENHGQLQESRFRQGRNAA